MTPLDSAITDATTSYTKTRSKALRVAIGTGSTQAQRIVAQAHMRAITRQHEATMQKLTKAKGD